MSAGTIFFIIFIVIIVAVVGIDNIEHEEFEDYGSCDLDAENDSTRPNPDDDWM